jgi:hypothetical protein
MAQPTQPVRGPREGFYTTYERGVMKIHKVIDPPPSAVGRASTSEERAEAERIREARRVEGERQSLERRRKREASQPPKRA